MLEERGFLGRLGGRMGKEVRAGLLAVGILANGVEGVAHADKKSKEDDSCIMVLEPETDAHKRMCEERDLEKWKKEHKTGESVLAFMDKILGSHTLNKSFVKNVPPQSGEVRKIDYAYFLPLPMNGDAPTRVLQEIAKTIAPVLQSREVWKNSKQAKEIEGKLGATWVIGNNAEGGIHTLLEFINSATK